MPLDCNELGGYNNIPCATPKNNKITYIAIIGTNATITDYGDSSQWLSDLNAGRIVLIKDTKGNFDGGTPTLSPGYGEQLERTTGIKHKISAMVRYVSENWEFINNLNKNIPNKGIAFVSGNGATKELNVVKVACNFSTKNPVTDDLSTEKESGIEISWSSIDLPQPFAYPLAFDTLPPIAAVASPATGITATSFIANWGVVAGATKYVLEVSTSNTFATILQTQTLANNTPYIVSGLTTATTYYYRVRASNFAGVSKNSNVITATTI